MRKDFFASVAASKRRIPAATTHIDRDAGYDQLDYRTRCIVDIGSERYGGQRVPVEVANLSGGLGEASPPIKITLAGRWLARRKHAFAHSCDNSSRSRNRRMGFASLYLSYELICTTDSQRIRIMCELSVVQI
jgi:hypothetical protein